MSSENSTKEPLPWIHEITQLYLSRAPISKILGLIEPLIDSTGLTASVQKELLGSTVLHEIASKFPACLKYRLLFLKKLIWLLEDRQIEISEEIYLHYTSLITSKEESVNYTSYFIRDEVITVEDTDSLVEDGTTGLHCWEAGKQFISYAANNKHLFKDKTILELGSGVGLTGVAICKLTNPRYFYFTDCEPQVLSLIERNITINQCNTNCKVIPFLWGSEADSRCLDSIKPELIIGSDLIYDPSLIGDLIDVIKKAYNLELPIIFLFTDRKTEALFEFEKALNESKNLNWTKEILSMDKKCLLIHSTIELTFHLYKINF